MAKCSICHSRKGKRLCMAFDGFACSLCCGQTRKKSTCEKCTYYKSPEESRLSGKDILLRREKDSDEYKNDPDKILFEPKGFRKMSEIILEFAEPLLDVASHYREQENSIYFAIMVWNMSLCSKRNQKEDIQNLINTICDTKEKLVIKDMKCFIEQLLKRKKKYFAQENRFIKDYHIKEGKNGDISLDVVSIIPQTLVTEDMKRELLQDTR
ncbi:hypothetical protein MNBD_UNCLBAC01-132 [hydrothermal vent metagenome]|uniref:Uncharacterized protein n=1 Tax=hydrothermal vent metagenome TaxID=652676 RepID=A0A3B1CZ16_9ZZZZ